VAPLAKVRPEDARDYMHLFVNRRAYTLQSTRPDSESGRHHYFRPKARRTGKDLSLTLDTVRRHLRSRELAAAGRPARRGVRQQRHPAFPSMLPILVFLAHGAANLNQLRPVLIKLRAPVMGSFHVAFHHSLALSCHRHNGR
jgi:hypothetical protein